MQGTSGERLSIGECQTLKARSSPKTPTPSSLSRCPRPAGLGRAARTPRAAATRIRSARANGAWGSGNRREDDGTENLRPRINSENTTHPYQISQPERHISPWTGARAWSQVSFSEFAGCSFIFFPVFVTEGGGGTHRRHLWDLPVTEKRASGPRLALEKSYNTPQKQQQFGLTALSKATTSRTNSGSAGRTTSVKPVSGIHSSSPRTG